MTTTGPGPSFFTSVIFLRAGGVSAYGEYSVADKYYVSAKSNKRPHRSEVLVGQYASPSVDHSVESP